MQQLQSGWECRLRREGAFVFSGERQGMQPSHEGSRCPNVGADTGLVALFPWMQALAQALLVDYEEFMRKVADRGE